MFEHYLEVKIAVLIVGEVILLLTNGLLASRRTGLMEHREYLKSMIFNLQPEFRQQTNRERRKAKWMRRELREVNEKINVTKKQHVVLAISALCCAVWLVVLVVILKYDTPPVELPTVSSQKTTSYEASKSIIPEEEDLVGKILFSRDDEYFVKHQKEIDEYSDEFGIDLDRMLEDYGFQFIGYDDELHGRTSTPPDDGYYWLTYANVETYSIIRIHSCGGWARCSVIEGEHYIMVPATYEEPETIVGLHEKEFLLNHDVLALLFEFLDGKPKNGREVRHETPAEIIQEYRI
ncbi:hypothetical protein IJ117_02685 [Candidatus Saccharibacteria bacterium]|nr:hypothetical protein [Candidatus Saccharibacteria bacterium]